MIKKNENVVGMKNKIKIAAIVFGTLVIVSLTLPVLATRLTTLSFGMATNPRPILTIRGLYDGSKTEFSGINYFFQLDSKQGTFTGWIITSNGKKLDAYGTYTLTKNDISGFWHLSNGQYGWISGHIGVD